MRNDKRHVQLRLTKQMKQELQTLSIKLGVSAADVARGSLFYGLPVFEAMAALQLNINRRLLKSLKIKSRKSGTKCRKRGCLSQ